MTSELSWGQIIVLTDFSCNLKLPSYRKKTTTGGGYMYLTSFKFLCMVKVFFKEFAIKMDIYSLPASLNSSQLLIRAWQYPIILVWDYACKFEIFYSVNLLQFCLQQYCQNKKHNNLFFDCGLLYEATSHPLKAVHHPNNSSGGKKSHHTLSHNNYLRNYYHNLCSTGWIPWRPW